MNEIVGYIIAFAIIFGIGAIIARSRGEEFFDFSFLPEIDRHTSVSQKTADNYGEFIEKGVLKLKSKGQDMNSIISLDKQKSVPGMDVRYQLCFMGQPIVKIKLTDELLKEAKMSGISKYLNKNMIEVETRVDRDMFHHSIQTFDVLLLNATLYASYPSYDKCKEIKKWLCGK